MTSPSVPLLFSGEGGPGKGTRKYVKSPLFDSLLPLSRRAGRTAQQSWIRISVCGTEGAGRAEGPAPEIVIQLYWMRVDAENRKIFTTDFGITPRFIWSGEASPPAPGFRHPRALLPPGGQRGLPPRQNPPESTTAKINRLTINRLFYRVAFLVSSPLSNMQADRRQWTAFEEMRRQGMKLSVQTNVV